MKNAQLLRVEAERDEARAALSRAEDRLLAGLQNSLSDANERRGWFASSASDRDAKMRLWIRAAFTEGDENAEGPSDALHGNIGKGKEGTSPKMV